MALKRKSKGSKGKFKFKKGATKASAKQAAQRKSFGYLQLPENVREFREEAGGRAKLDIVPYIVKTKQHPDYTEEHDTPVKGDPWFRFPFLIHRNIGPENDKVICPKTFGLPCPVCERRAVMVQEKADKKDIEKLNHSRRSLYNVIPIDMKDFDEEIHVWDISDHCFFKLLNQEIDEDEDYEGFWFPDGFTLRIRFSEEEVGSGKNKGTFAKASRIDFDPRDEAIEEEVIENAPCLDEIVYKSLLSYEQLEAKFYGVDQEPEPEEEVEEEEPEEKEEEVEEEEEPEEKPARKKKSKSKKKKPEMPEDWDEVQNLSENEAIEIGEHMEFDLDSMEDVEELKAAIAEELDIEKPKKSKKQSSDKKKDNKKSSKKKEGKNSKKASNKCPFGHTFGEDCEQYKDCEDCDEYEDCLEEHG